MASELSSPSLFTLYHRRSDLEDFTIDANFGVVAAVVEILLQSHHGELRLLPALPTEWNEGSVSGLRARGGFSVDITRNDHQLDHAKLRSIRDRICRIRDDGGRYAVHGPRGGTVETRGIGSTLEFAVETRTEHTVRLSIPGDR